MSQPYNLRKQPQVAFRPPQIEGPQRELPQSEAAQIEAPQNKPSQTEVPQNELPRLMGFFKLSHAIFCDSAIRKLSGDSFRLFLWMSTQAWRFPDSDGTLRASLTYIELGTGVSLATISRSLKQLKEEGLVDLVEKNFKRGNIWRVSRVASHDPEDPKGKTQDTQSEPPQNKVPQIDRAIPSNRESTSLTLRVQDPQNEGQPRTSKNSLETKNSLSGIDSEKLREYFASIKESRKRESEWADCRGLLGSYTEADVELALEYLRANGVGTSGEKCHSPMAFLAKAMQSVLEKARAWRKTTMEVRATVDAELQKRQEEERKQEQDQLVIEANIMAFVEAFPDEEVRLEVVDRYCAGSLIAGARGRLVVAAQRWVEGLQSVGA